MPYAGFKIGEFAFLTSRHSLIAIQEKTVHSAQLLSVCDSSQDVLGMNTADYKPCPQHFLQGMGGSAESNKEVILMVSGAMAKMKQGRHYCCMCEGRAGGGGCLVSGCLLALSFRSALQCQWSMG